MRTTEIRRLFVAALYLLALLACGAAQAQTYQWDGRFRFPGTFFPSFAISAAGKDAKGPTDNQNVYGYYESSSFAVLVQGTHKGSVVKVHVSIPEIGVAGEIEAPPQPTDTPRSVVPRLSWSPAKLVSISQPLSTDVIFQVFVDGQPMGEQRKPVRVRAITDAPLRFCPKGGNCQDYSQYFAGFVNENNPVIDKVLRATLDIPAMPVKVFDGTSSGEASVFQQVWAIWYFLQRNKVTYSSIVTTSDGSSELMSQAVRPISQSLGNSQANCIDGTVLFASILRKIGIEPILVLVPGHAYLGFYLDSQNKSVAYLETTMLNDDTNPFHQKGPTQAGTNLSKFLVMDTHMAKSRQSFNEAIEQGRQRFSIDAPFFDKKQGYSYLPVKRLRDAGVLPLPL